MLPLWDVQAQFDAELQAKVSRYLGEWLPGIEAELDRKGLEANIYVIYESPYTPGGPFAQIPTAIVTAKVTHVGPLYQSDEPRRGMKLGIQAMQTRPDPIVAAAWVERQLISASRPESYFLGEIG